MNSQPESESTIDDIRSQESSIPIHPASDSPAHARLNRAVRQCRGWSPALQSGLGVLDAATATALASMLEQLRAEAVGSGRGGWVRGFSAGQQF